jgi:hypothetical protein
MAKTITGGSLFTPPPAVVGYRCQDQSVSTVAAVHGTIEGMWIRPGPLRDAEEQRHDHRALSRDARDL